GFFETCLKHQRQLAPAPDGMSPSMKISSNHPSRGARRHNRQINLFLAACFGLAACAHPTAAPTPALPPEPTLAASVTPVATVTSVATATGALLATAVAGSTA